MFMDNNELYYYKCGIGIGSCDKTGKERIDNFLNHLEDNDRLKKKTKWISKREYFIRLRISALVGILLLPIYLLTYYLGMGFIWIANKIEYFITNKIRI